jgi:carbonic anhydrase
VQTDAKLKLSDIINTDVTGAAAERAKGFYAYTGSLTAPPCTEVRRRRTPKTENGRSLLLDSIR